MTLGRKCPRFWHRRPSKFRRGCDAHFWGASSSWKALSWVTATLLRLGAAGWAGRNERE